MTDMPHILQAELLTNRAVAALRLNKKQDALRDAQAAKALAPAWPKAAFREGQAYRALGELADAAASFWEAHRLDPKSPEARENFNQCVFESKQAQALQKGALSSNADKSEAELKEWAAKKSSASS